MNTTNARESNGSVRESQACPGQGALRRLWTLGAASPSRVSDRALDPPGDAGMPSEPADMPQGRPASADAARWGAALLDQLGIGTPRR